ncbi:hypothetical protein [Paenibacillus mesotrionivorans]|uniref:Uncharacterized protein n=1 Tax=Paenibacillus mesotrionivorans TaxID=3160968 RepID=A0ACC7NQ66_9BACL
MRNKRKTKNIAQVPQQLDFSFLKRPEIQLALAGLLGLLFIIFSISVLYVPQLTEASRTAEELEAANRRVEQLTKAPVPVKIQEADVEALLMQVPLRENTASILNLMQSFSEQAGTKLSYVTFKEVTDKQAQLETLITKAAEIQQNQPSSGVTVQPLGTPAPAGQTQPVATELASLTFQVEVSGTYGQTMDFLHQLQQGSRLLEVVDWSLSQTSASAATGSPSAMPTSTSSSPSPKATPGPSSAFIQGPMPLALKCTVRSFVAAAYQNQLKEPPGPQVSPGTQRTDPTWSDQMLYELLDKQQ